MKRIMKFFSALMIIVAFLGFSMALQIHATAGAELFVDPADSVFQSPPMVVGSTLTVNVTIANITGLCSLQFRLSWDPTMLSCQGIQEVLFHTVTPSSYWSYIVSYTLRYNNTGGYADYAQSWVDFAQAEADGYAPANVTTANFPPEGKLTTVMLTMRVEKRPPFHGNMSCALHLNKVIAGDQNAIPIPLTMVDGAYTLIWSPPATHPYFEVSPPIYVAGSLGEIFNISVHVNNLDPGCEAIFFDFKLGYNSTLLQVLNVWEGSLLPPYGGLPNQGTIFVSAFGSDYVQAQEAVLPDNNGTWHAPFPGGSGVLAIIEFNSTMQGMFPLEYFCALHLYGTSVVDSLLWDVTQDFAVDGIYQIMPQLPPQGRQIDVFGGASNLGYGSGYPGPFPAPYGGQGPNQPMDLVFPQSNVSLFANVTYNGVPVQSVDVMFELVGPSSSVTLHATTDSTGTANLTYSMPWPVGNPASVIGLWHVTASATVSGSQISDALSFFYDYAVRIWRVSTDKYYYKYSDVVGVWLTYGTRAIQMYPALFVVGLENSSGVPFSLANVSTIFGGSRFGDYQNFSQWVGLVIPHLPGVGGYSYVHVNCYDKDPGVGGVQLCPEYAPPVEIVVTISGDVNHDGRVNILDSILVSNAFLSTPGSPNWNPDADINGDGVVNILDAIIQGNHFLEHYP